MDDRAKEYILRRQVQTLGGFRRIKCLFDNGIKHIQYAKLPQHEHIEHHVNTPRVKHKENYVKKQFTQ